jgi:hypothetical protein
MKKLRIGYWPLSPNLSSAGDRRRLIFWAQARGHTIVTDLTQSVDLIVASENIDFNSRFFDKTRVPIIFDLVDAYLSPLSPFDDLARGIAKKISGQIGGGVKPFSHHVKDFCLRANAVICSSVEQEAAVNPYNLNTHAILDSHDEIPFNDMRGSKALSRSVTGILWEGQPATLRGIRQISSVLAELAKENELRFNFVTDEKYFQYLGKFVQRRTQDLVERELHQAKDRVRIIPWSVDRLVFSASESTVAMIPINLNVPMQRLKPENRLLIMWRLGLPCLTSPSPAYRRVADKAGVSAICVDPNAWLENFNKLFKDSRFALDEVIRGQDYLMENHNRTSLLKKWDIAVASVFT